MSTYKGDVFIKDVVHALVDGIVAEFAESELSAVGWAAGLPGAIPAMDFGGEECGQSWVRVASAFPVASFPTQAALLNPGVGGWHPAFQLEVGTIRCTPVTDLDSKSAPSEQMEWDVFDEQMDDIAAMRRAICKVLNAANRDFVIGTYTPIGPDGAIAGGFWSVTVDGKSNGS